MLRYIHYSESLPKLLRGLRKTGRKAELAAGKCEAILNDIRQFGGQHETVSSKRTHHGEARIKNCIKYDLGGGYRLVTVRIDSHLFVCFVGGHDETNLWIERHRYDILIPGDPLYRCEERVVRSDSGEADSHQPGNVSDTEDQYEDELRTRLDEARLKTIFQGLFANSASPAEQR